MYRSTCFLACLLVALAAPVLAADPAPAPAPAPAAPAAAECTDAELKADVPQLGAFHEVIMPLWHDAWPNRNFGLMRELMPRIREHVATLQAVELPGILRDRKVKWDEGVKGVAANAGQLETALAAKDDQGALDAAESLHAGFEGLVRIVRPRMAELDAYHQVLYRIYHYDWPNKDLVALRTHAQELAERAGALQGAPVPKRYAAKEAQLRDGFVALAAATDGLKLAAAGDDAKSIDKAVEQVHTRYQLCDRLFE